MTSTAGSTSTSLPKATSKVELRSLARYYYERVVSGYGDVRIGEVSLRKPRSSSSYDSARPGRPRQVLPDAARGIRATGRTGLLYYRLAENLELLGEWEAVYEAYRNVLRYPDLRFPVNRTRIGPSRIAWSSTTARRTGPSDRRRPPAHHHVGAREQGHAHARPLPGRRELLHTELGAGFRRSEHDTALGYRGAPASHETRAQHRPREVDIDADGDEAYLWTYGWGGLRIRTWYLYFRKVHFPPDPEIHGTWEWAGIFLGERL